MGQKCWTKMLLQLPLAENDTLDQQPPVRCQTDKKLPDPGGSQRDHSNDNADPVHENLDNTQ